MDAVAGYKNEYKPVKKLTQVILTIIGISMSAFAVSMIITNSNTFVNADTGYANEICILS